MKTFTKAFETTIARMFFEDFTSNTDKNYYIFGAKTTPFENGSTLPTVGKGVTSSFYDIHDQIIFGKRLTSSDIRYMVKKNVWSTGTVYDIYDDKDETLYDKNFFVFTLEGDQYSLFKCLYNNFGATSIDQPLRSRTSFDDDLYQTGDGYVWKLMTTISATEFAKFETDDYAPLEHVTEAPTYANDGALDVILVEEEGANYNTFAYGSVKSTAYDDDPRQIVIQTDTERDIYELAVIQYGRYPETNVDQYIWTFNSSDSTTDIFNELAVADYSNTATHDAEYLGTNYASGTSLVQVSRAADFNISYADFIGSGNIFIVTDDSGVDLAPLYQGILKATSSIEPELTLFSVDVGGGRKLGDVTGNGAIGADDALSVAQFFAGTLTNPTEAAYIQSVLIPFIYANYSTYSDYLPISFGIVTGLQIILVPELSANNNFYSGSSLYIRGGTGAGQLKTITDYDIIGNDRVLTIDTAFGTELDSTSRYEIAPKVVISGDGTGAQAVTKSTLPGGDSAVTNGIRAIEVIDTGSGYTYADLTISSNTGVIDTSGNSVSPVPARVRAIISPPGGHGANIINETYASALGLSADFVSNEHTIENDYHVFGIMSNPVFRSVVLEVDDASAFANNQLITQATTGAKGYIQSIDGETITLERVQGVWSTAYDIIEDTGNVDVVSVTGDTTKFDNRTVLEIETTVLGQQFEADELITQETSGATGYVHFHDTDNDILYLNEAKGTFSSGSGFGIVGESSGVVASINSVTESDIYPDTGEILYIETVESITRNTNQTERVKIVTKF